MMIGNIEAYRLLFLALAVLAMLAGLERLSRRTCRGGTDVAEGAKSVRREFCWGDRRFRLGILLFLEGFLLLLGSFVRLETHPIFFMAIWLLAIVFLFWLMLHCFMDLARVSLLAERYREELLSEELRAIVSSHRHLSDSGSDGKRDE